MIDSDIGCIPDMARVWCDKTPDKPALLDGGRIVTYAQLNDRSNRIANTLIAADVRPGHPVGVTPFEELLLARDDLRITHGRIAIQALKPELVVQWAADDLEDCLLR